MAPDGQEIDPGPGRLLLSGDVGMDISLIPEDHLAINCIVHSRVFSLKLKEDSGKNWNWFQMFSEIIILLGIQSPLAEGLAGSKGHLGSGQEFMLLKSFF